MHFQDKRSYGCNAVTMATSPIFFFTTIHFLVQTYQAIKKIWLCFVLPWGGVTPISRPLLDNGRSTSYIYFRNDFNFLVVYHTCQLRYQNDIILLGYINIYAVSTVFLWTLQSQFWQYTQYFTNMKKCPYYCSHNDQHNVAYIVYFIDITMNIEL